MELEITTRRKRTPPVSTLGRGKAAATEESAPFLYDVDAEGRILGIDILSCSKVLAPGQWQNARRPGATSADAAE